MLVGGVAVTCLRPWTWTDVLIASALLLVAGVTVLCLLAADILRLIRAYSAIAGPPWERR